MEANTAPIGSLRLSAASFVPVGSTPKLESPQGSGDANKASSTQLSDLVKAAPFVPQSGELRGRCAGTPLRF
jgi:hypothetical protein